MNNHANGGVQILLPAAEGVKNLTTLPFSVKNIDERLQIMVPAGDLAGSKGRVDVVVFFLALFRYSVNYSMGGDSIFTSQWPHVYAMTRRSIASPAQLLRNAANSRPRTVCIEIPFSKTTTHFQGLNLSTQNKIYLTRPGLMHHLATMFSNLRSTLDDDNITVNWLRRKLVQHQPLPQPLVPLVAGDYLRLPTWRQYIRGIHMLPP